MHTTFLKAFLLGAGFLATLPAQAKSPFDDPKFKDYGMVIAVNPGRKSMNKTVTVYVKDDKGRVKKYADLDGGFGWASDQDMDGYVDNLSNRQSSNRTPWGRFRATIEKGGGKLGTVMRLWGKDKENQNSAKRGILVHKGYKRNPQVDVLKRRHGEGTPAYIAAMKKLMDNVNTSWSTYTHGCISVAHDVKMAGGKSQWEFVLAKAMENKNRGIGVYIENVIPDRHVAGTSGDVKKMIAGRTQSGEKGKTASCRLRGFDPYI